MKLLSYCILVLCSLQSFAQGIAFEHGSWAEVKAKAAKENKFIFVDAFTTWCGPCKWMAANVFTTEEVGKFYNTNFVSYKFDMEKGEGVDFAKQYAVNFYPTYLFFDSKGEIVHRSGSSKEAANFVEDGKHAINPDQQLYTLMANYKAGKGGQELVKNYLYALNDAGLGKEAEAPLTDYINQHKESDLLNAETANLFMRLTKKTSDKSYQFLTAHFEEFSKMKAVDIRSFVLNLSANSYYGAGKSKNATQKTEIEQNINQQKFDAELKKEMIAYGNVLYYQGAQDWNQYFTATVNLMNGFSKYANSAGYLNSVAWSFFENLTDKKQLEKGAEYAKKSVEIDKGFANADTYANLLFKLKKYKEAKKWAEEAISLGKAEKQNVADTETLLTNINAHLK